MGNLITKSEVKDSLDIEHTDFDSDIDDLIDEAEASMEDFIGTPVVTETFTEHFDGDQSRFILERSPIDSTSVTVTDLETPGDSADNETLTEDEDYRVDAQAGIIYKITTEGAWHRRNTFASGIRRFKVEYDAGLEQSDDWSREEKVLKSSIRMLVVANFETPNPRKSRQQFASGASEQITISKIPNRVLEKWERFTEGVVF